MYPPTEKGYDQLQGNCFSQGIYGQGTAILLNGEPVTSDNIVKMLNDYFKMVNGMRMFMPDEHFKFLIKQQNLDPEIVDMVSDNFEELMA